MSDFVIPAWFEITSLIVVSLILIVDLLLVVRRPHVPSPTESALWVAFYVALALVFALAGPALIDVMTTAEPVRDAARDFLPWMILAPLVGAAPWMLDGIFIGATRTRDMRNMMAVSALIYAAAALILTPTLGNHGLWAALNISFVARGLTLWRRYPALEADADRAAA